MSRTLIYRLNRLEIARQDRILGVRYAISGQPVSDGDYGTPPLAPERDCDMTEDEWVREYCKP